MTPDLFCLLIGTVLGASFVGAIVGPSPTGGSCVMAAEMFQPITVRVLTRPLFCNKNLSDQGLWEFDNALALARYWNDQGNVLGLEPDTTDFDLWLRVQYDLEWQRHHRRLLPHGSSL